MKGRELSESPVLAIDIGGTKIITALITRDGNIAAEERHPTLADEGVERVRDRLFTAIDSLPKKNGMELLRLAGISLAMAGGIDVKRGVVTFSPNMPGWCDIPLRDIIKERFGVNTYLINDASAAALGEHHLGAGQGVKHLVMLTLGTGIGGGIIINDEMYSGVSGSAGEIGHMVIDVNGPACACGNHGCLEAMASGTAVARDAISRIRRGEKSALVELVGGNLEGITAEKVGAAARKGDTLSLDVLRRTASYLSIGLSNIVNIFNPEMIILGGGMAKLGEILIESARRVVADRAFPISARAVRIVTARLGDKAGVHGAAVFAFQQIVRRSR